VADNDQRYLHEPVDDFNGRPGYLVHDTTTGELVGFRADSAAQATGDAANGGSRFPTMGTEGFTVRDSSAETGRQLLRLRLAEPPDRGGPEVRVLPEFTWHDRRPEACPGCAADRSVKFPPALPPGTDVAS
jgi:hypothetical protein